MSSAKTSRFMRKHEVMRVTGLRTTKIWELEKVGDFPKRIKLSERASGWLESEITDWVERRVAASREAISTDIKTTA